MFKYIFIPNVIILLLLFSVSQSFSQIGNTHNNTNQNWHTNQPSSGELSINSTVYHTHCQDSCNKNGRIELSITGGIPWVKQAPYKASILKLGDPCFCPCPVILSYSDGFNNLCAGTYIITVGDSLDTQVSDTVTVNNHACRLPKNTISVACGIGSTTCSGKTQAYAIVIDSGDCASSVLKYKWDNGETSRIASSLSAGNHCVIVTNCCGCSDTCCVTIPAQNPISISPFIIPVGCFGPKRGAIYSNASGGSPPYSYVWNTGANTASIFGLPIGIYTVTVTDVNGCTASKSIGLSTIDTTPPSAICRNLTVQLNAQGKANILASSLNGGSVDNCAIQSFSASVTNFTCEHLGTIPIVLSVTDNSGNSSTCTSMVTVQALPISTACSISNATSPSTFDGGINLSVSGGCPPYSYSWFGPNVVNATTQDLVGLAAGAYTVTITDAAGTTVIKTAVVGQASSKIGEFSETGTIPQVTTIYAYPNPFSGSVSIGFTLTRKAKTSIQVLSVIGESVRKEELGIKETGSHEWVWNGKGANGESKPAGVYLLQLNSGGEMSIIKLILIE